MGKHACRTVPGLTDLHLGGDALFEDCDHGDGVERTEIGITTIGGVVLYFISDGWAWFLHDPDAGSEGE